LPELIHLVTQLGKGGWRLERSQVSQFFQLSNLQTSNSSTH
jgi:hypothetical protein